MTESEFKNILQSRATGLVPGVVPSDEILAGARRRTARRRASGATLAVLATAGVAAGVVTAAGSGSGAVATGSAATPKPTKSVAGEAKGPDRYQPKITQVVGLAAGQTVDKDTGMQDDGTHVAPVPQGTVVASGTIDGVPWQLQAVRVVDPAPTDPFFGGPDRWVPPAGKHAYCESTPLYVDHQLVQGGYSCGPDDDFNGAGLQDAIGAGFGGTEFHGHEGVCAAGMVRSDVAKVVWTWGDGQSLTTIPVVSPIAKVHFLAIPFGGMTGHVKVVAYDASGKAVGELPVQEELVAAAQAQADQLATLRASMSATPKK